MKKSLHDLYEKKRYKFGTSSSRFYSFLTSLNQDVESLDFAVKEDIEWVIKDPKRKYLKLIIKGIEEFLANDNYTDIEKEYFLNNEIEVPTENGGTYLQWLKEIVLPEMKKSL